MPGQSEAGLIATHKRSRLAPTLRRSWHWLGLVAVVFVALPLAVPAAEAAGASLTWSAPIPLDLANGTLRAVSCPSASLCVAVDQSGNVVTSTNPTGGPSAWTAASIDASNLFLNGVSCQTASLCVAVDGNGDAVRSTNPTGGASAWSTTPISANGLNGVSCPSTTSLCVAVDGGGDVVTSTNGGSTWSSPVNVDSSTLLTAVSCTSAPLCVAVDQNGNSVASTDPTGGALKWTTTTADSGDDLLSVSCVPGSTSCVAVAYGGNAVSTIDGSTWSSPVTLGGSPLIGVSCPSALLCVAVDGAGNLWSSSDPFAASPTWNSVSVDASAAYYMSAISCASAALCVAVDTNGSALASTDPTGDASNWPATEIDASNGEPREIFGLSCAPTSFCAGVDDSGNVLTSADPGGGAAAWSLANIDSTNSLESMSCPTSSLCVAGDANGNLVTSTNPAGGSAAWSAPIPVATEQMFGIACPSEALCVAVDQDGSIASSSDPTNSGAWNVANNVDGSSVITGVSCPTESFCVAVDNAGNALTSTDPTSGSWTPTSVGDPNTNNLEAVACPSVSLCVVVDTQGDVLASTNPGAGSPSWTSANVDGSNVFSAIACPTTALCFAVDGSGNVVSSTDPTGGVSAWSTEHVDGTITLTSISCPVITVCLTADRSGNVLVGSSPPAVTTGSAGSVGETGVTLSGTVNPSGLNVSDCHFSYGIGSPSGANAPCSASPGSGTSDVPVSANLSGLLGGTTYEFRLVAKTGGGTTFGAVGMFTTVGVLLTVSRAGSGSGTVTSSPAGISCGATCSDRYPHGTPVGLTATPAAGSTFAGWAGGGCSGIGTCTVATNADTAVTATFNLAPETLDVEKSGTGSGSVTSSPPGISCGATCSHAYAHGTSVTLTATPAEGSTFAGWAGGGCSGTGTCTVTTNLDTTVTATFKLVTPPLPQKCMVPKVKGKTLKAAKRAIKNHACTVGTIKHATSRTVEKGHVISQKPKPGRRLKHGAKVNLVVSKGP